MKITLILTTLFLMLSLLMNSKNTKELIPTNTSISVYGENSFKEDELMLEDWMIKPDSSWNIK